MNTDSLQIIRPTRRLLYDLNIPGDKSISHRALMLGAAAKGITTIRNLAPGRDVAATRTCLEAMGVTISGNPRHCTVHGASLRAFKAPAQPLNTGNSGTTFRLLSGLLAGSSFPVTLTGDASLCRRPMARIARPLRRMGVESRLDDGERAPMTLEPATPGAIDYTSPMASAQVKSCVLLAGLSAEGRITVTEPALSRDHTERLLPAFGVPVTRKGLQVSIHGPANLTPADVHVPGDPSSAAFFAAAAVLTSDSQITLRHVGSNPTRTGFFEVLQRMGARLYWGESVEQCGEPRADLVAESSVLKPISLSAEEIPTLIDELPLLALLATQANGTSILRHAAELRHKECDRIASTARNLRAMGAAIEMHDDGWTVKGPTPLSGAAIETRGDHRMAMTFAVAGLIASGATVIRGANCAAVSYPDFFKDLRNVAHV